MGSEESYISQKICSLFVDNEQPNGLHFRVYLGRGPGAAMISPCTSKIATPSQSLSAQSVSWHGLFSLNFMVLDLPQAQLLEALSLLGCSTARKPSKILAAI